MGDRKCIVGRRLQPIEREGLLDDGRGDQQPVHGGLRQNGGQKESKSKNSVPLVLAEE